MTTKMPSHGQFLIIQKWLPLALHCHMMDCLRQWRCHSEKLLAFLAETYD